MTKSDRNIHQDAPNYIIFNNFLGEHASNPLSKRMEQKLCGHQNYPPPSPDMHILELV